jgi:hypothetical protein
MNLLEVGIIISSVPVCCKRYVISEEEGKQDEKEQQQQNIFKSAYISGILSFAEKLSSQVEYFEMKKKHITFKKDQINNEDIYAYIILDKEKNFGKVFDKTIKPLLEEIIKAFKSKYSKMNSFTDVSQFDEFKEVLDEKVEELTKSRFQALKDKLF